jgi:hypothetical protein
MAGAAYRLTGNERLITKGSPDELRAGLIALS